MKIPEGTILLKRATLDNLIDLLSEVMKDRATLLEAIETFRIAGDGPHRLAACLILLETAAVVRVASSARRKNKEPNLVISTTETLEKL